VARAEASGCICKELIEDNSRCEGCGWAQQGINCWEVEVSPCCDLPRSACSQCPVYISYLRLYGTSMRVVMGTDDGAVLEGTVHVPHRQRLSDLMNDDSRRFLAVREPRWRQGVPAGLPEGKVVIVGISHVAWAVPIEEAAEHTAEEEDTTERAA